METLVKVLAKRFCRKSKKWEKVSTRKFLLAREGFYQINKFLFRKKRNWIARL